jgi:uncharacterized metal-binding protein
MKDQKTDRETQSYNHQTKAVIFFSCSGASNCGQIANQVAVKLTEEGVGKMFCIAGLGAHNEGMIQAAKSADRIVAIDGCNTACSRKVLDHLGLTVTDCICVTDMGIEKVHKFNILSEEITIALSCVRKLLVT